MIVYLRVLALAVTALGVLAMTLVQKSEAPLLASIFTDHMVIQRDAPIAVWGKAAPGDRVTIRLGRQSKSARAGDDGAWKVEFPAMGAGGPYTLDAETHTGRTQSITDVFVGDVFLCSGQSNMELPVSRALGADWEARQPTAGPIRHLFVQHHASPKPRDEFENALEWTVAGPETTPSYSAVCYFFARELQKTHNVPMGLIHSSWGGSQIEAWISPRGLRELGGFDTQLGLLDLYAEDHEAAVAKFGATWQDWWQAHAPGDPEPWNADGAALKAWTPVPGPMRDWKDWGVESLRDHNGMVWFAREVTLTPEQAAQGATLNLGSVDELDYTWVNGRFINSTFGWGDRRSYDLSAGTFKPGENIIIVNVLNTWGIGGMTGPDDQMNLTFADGSKVGLGGGWRYKQVPADIGYPPRTPWESIGGYTSLYNAMIAPLKGARFKGALWYQGESNADRADAYEGLLKELIADWRHQLKAALPMIVIQLPNFGALAATPVESGWARVRDAERRAATDDSSTGLVVTIDVGDRMELHPPQKQAVGRRAARVARSLIYGENLTPSGPMVAGATRKGDEITVTFSGVADKLVAMSDERPIAFEACNADGSACRFVPARIDGTAVILNPEAGAPASVIRYCWADAPICNLYDGAELPASPFEIRVERD